MAMRSTCVNMMFVSLLWYMVTLSATAAVSNKQQTHTEKTTNVKSSATDVKVKPNHHKESKTPPIPQLQQSPLGFDGLTDVSRKFLEELILSVEKEVQDKWKEGNSVKPGQPQVLKSNKKKVRPNGSGDELQAKPKMSPVVDESDVAMELKRLAFPFNHRGTIGKANGRQRMPNSVTDDTTGKSSRKSRISKKPSMKFTKTNEQSS